MLKNTLSSFKANHSWTGLLVEPNSAAFRGLVKKNRKVWRILSLHSRIQSLFLKQSHGVHSCLSVSPHPDIVEFDSADVFGGIHMELQDVDNKDLERVIIQDYMRLYINPDFRSETVSPRNWGPGRGWSATPCYSLLLATDIAQKVCLAST